MREMGMGVHAAALSPMHTWVRFARADDAAVAITCACARVRPPAYVANAHVMCQYICVYIYRRKVRVCEWVRVCVILHARAIARGR